MTKSELYRQYARIIDSCTAANIDPLTAVKFNGKAITATELFDKAPDSYLFACGIVQGVPVFIGDTLYLNNDPQVIGKYDLRGAVNYLNNYQESAWTIDKTITLSVIEARPFTWAVVDKTSTVLGSFKLKQDAVTFSAKLAGGTYLITPLWTTDISIKTISTLL